jgi:hypothetical protein
MLPVMLKDETIGDLVLHSFLTVHLGVKHLKTEIQDGDGKDEAETQGQTPGWLKGILTADGVQYDGNNSTKKETTTREYSLAKCFYHHKNAMGILTQ